MFPKRKAADLNYEWALHVVARRGQVAQAVAAATLCGFVFLEHSQCESDFHAHRQVAHGEINSGEGLRTAKPAVRATR